MASAASTPTVRAATTAWAWSTAAARPASGPRSDRDDDGATNVCRRPAGLHGHRGAHHPRGDPHRPRRAHDAPPCHLRGHRQRGAHGRGVVGRGVRAGGSAPAALLRARDLVRARADRCRSGGGGRQRGPGLRPPPPRRAARRSLPRPLPRPHRGVLERRRRGGRLGRRRARPPIGGGDLPHPPGGAVNANERGFTLIELMIGMALTGLVMSFIFMVSGKMSSAYFGQSQVAEVQQTLRTARAAIAADVRQAGFFVSNGFRTAAFGDPAEVVPPLEVVNDADGSGPDLLRIYYADATAGSRVVRIDPAAREFADVDSAAAFGVGDVVVMVNSAVAGPTESGDVGAITYMACVV